MRQVALAAGVSQSTVSKALRNDPAIPAPTRERIQQVAREMNYRPNPMVATLMAQLHGRRPSSRVPTVVALGLPGGDGTIFRTPAGVQFLNGATQRAENLGYALELRKLPRDPVESAPMFRQLQYRRVVGVIVMPLPVGVHELGWDFAPFASVALGRSLYTPRLNHVSPHHSANVTLLFRALRERGYQRIGFVMSRVMSAQVEHGWLAGYARLLHMGEEGTLAPCTPIELNAAVVRSWMEEHRPDAVIAKETHLVPPWLNDIPVFSPGRISDKDFPGVDEDRHEVGAAALDIVVGQLHANVCGIPARAHTILIEGKLSPELAPSA